MKKKTIFYSITFVIILGLAVYANSLGGKFIWDDDNLVRHNMHIRSWANLPKIFTEDIGASAGRDYNFYRPLQMLSYMADYSLWRLETRGYHLTNIALHILAALAIYWLINILYNNIFLSLFTSVFFLTHPLHTEVVAYISGRCDSLALLFMLLCFIFYIKYLSSNRISIYFLAVLSYILALLSRENGLILPLLLLLYHYTFNKKITLKSFLPILTIALAYILLRAAVLTSFLTDLSHQPSILERIPGFFVAIIEYLRLLLLPLNLHMEYGNRLFSFGNPKAIAGLLVTSSLLIYAFKKRRTNKLALFSICWFFISLIPVSHIYPLNAYMAEHWLYLPSIGFCLILANYINTLYETKNFRILAIVLIVILSTFYSCLTIIQNDYWKEPISFYTRTLKYAPGSFRVYYNLGTAYSNVGKYDAAIISYKRTLDINPYYADAYYNLGNAYSAIGERIEAISAYNKAIDTDPNYSKAYNNMGNIYSDIGKNEEAIALYKSAIEVNPNYADAYYNLGDEYRKIGKNKEAIMLYRKAAEINPNDAATHNNLAVVYYYEKQYELAVRHCDRAIELGYPVHPEFLKTLESYRR